MNHQSSATWSGIFASGAAALVIVSLVSILLGAAFDDEGEAKRIRSMHNLRALGMANATYAAEWVDQQFTPLPHNLARYGDAMEDALANYRNRHERDIAVRLRGDDTLLLDTAEQRRWLWPVSFDERPVGWFRMANLIHEYLDGNFQGSQFYAPHDAAALEEIAKRKEAAGKNGDAPFDRDPNSIVWSSYAWSPAGLYSPIVLGRQPIQDRGFTGPFADPGGFRVPTFSQCRYPDLKTHLIEHHWLQNAPEGRVNKAFGDSRYAAFGGEPYYFNHGRTSRPNVLFYDGHVSAYSLDHAAKSDTRMRDRNKEDFAEIVAGMWLRSPGGAVHGYYENMAVDDLRASPHIFTTDGIVGRDVTRE